MTSKLCAVFLLLLLLPLGLLAHADGIVKIDRSTRYQDIIEMDPKDVDPSGLPLTSVASLHSTGMTLDVDLSTWRLTLGGTAAKTPLSLSFEDLEPDADDDQEDDPDLPRFLL